MNIPPFAPFPPAAIRATLGEDKWQASLEAWTQLSNLLLELPQKDFLRTISDNDSLALFLTSYMHEVLHDPRISGTRTRALNRNVFLVVHRLILSDGPLSPSIVHWSFLLDLCRVHVRSRNLRQLLGHLWETKDGQVAATLHKLKHRIIGSLEKESSESIRDIFSGLAALLHTSPEAGAFFTTGSDFLDSLGVAYRASSPSIRKKLVRIAYLGLTSLLEGQRANQSLLLDHLYSLKGGAERQSNTDENDEDLLSDLVTNTPLLRKLQGCVGVNEASRTRSLLDSLLALRRSPPSKSKRSLHHRSNGLKLGILGQSTDIHVHRLSQITQIQDLFPDLGSAFIVKLLDAYNDSIEAVTAALLDNLLPPHLEAADRSENLAPSMPSPADLAPRSTPQLSPKHKPLPIRRNKYDNDELDRLALDTSRLHIGRRDAQETADSLLADRSHHHANKAAILAALSAFDADDDERDDTYDEADVGATVDSSATGTSDPAERDDGRDVPRGTSRASIGIGEAKEELLYREWKKDKATFGRGPEIRRSVGRRRLKDELGLSDEVLEGWAVMLGKDGGRALRRLETKYDLLGEAGGGGRLHQNALASTAWRSQGPSDDTEESEGGADAGSGSGREEGARGGFRGRGGEHGGGRGRGRGRGGGGTSDGAAVGQADGSGTQIARLRKEANKGSRANHNRRDQRAKKMARGGFAP